MAASVLVVEDESIVALDIQSRLAALGVDVVGSARDGSTAIRIAGEKRPNLILMDIQIAGDLDGIETAGIIGEQYGIPSVFLTAYSDRESLERAKQSHGYGYLLKPFQERELMIAIEMALFKHDTEEQLRTNRAMLKTTLDTIDEGVITTDSEGRVILINRAAEELIGWATEEVLGSPLEKILQVKPRDSESGPLGITMVLRRDGTSFPAELVRKQLSDVAHDSGSTVVVIRDVTSVLDYQNRLINARNAAESAARAKSEFMARMSHEFRTPLNTILGMTTLVLDKSDDPSVREYLEISQSAGEEMKDLVTELLDYAAHETEEIKLRNELFSPRELVHSVARTYALDVARRGLRMAVVLGPSVVGSWYGDQQRIRQVLRNLVSNAVKFTAEGTIVVKLEYVPAAGDDPARAVFTVEDTGTGIPEDKLEEVFSEFTQLEDTRTRSAGGTGLGLATARKLARAMEGEVVLKGRVTDTGRGTTAVFTVPISREPSPDDDPNGKHTPEDDELLQGFSGITRPFAVSDPLIRMVLEPWIAWKDDKLLQPDHDSGNGPGSGPIVVLSVSEYEEIRRGEAPGVTGDILVSGPVGGETILCSYQDDAARYVPEPVTFRAILSAISGDRACPCGGAKLSGTRADSSSGTDSGSEPFRNSPLHDLRKMLQNGALDDALDFANRSRTADLDANDSEVLFRVLLALRKKIWIARAECWTRLSDVEDRTARRWGYL